MNINCDMNNLTALESCIGVLSYAFFPFFLVSPDFPFKEFQNVC